MSGEVDCGPLGSVDVLLKLGDGLLFGDREDLLVPNQVVPVLLECIERVVQVLLEDLVEVLFGRELGHVLLVTVGVVVVLLILVEEL